MFISSTTFKLFHYISNIMLYFMLQNHTDITSLKKDNLEILNIKIKAIEIDKLITTGYTILPQRIKTFIEHMNIGDIAIIRLLSVADT